MMPKAKRVCLGLNWRVWPEGPHIWPLALMLSLLVNTVFLSHTATAQEAVTLGSRQSSSDSCTVFSRSAGERIPLQLIAKCGDRAFPLRLATRFKAITNDALGATLIDLYQDDERRVFLLSIQENGEPLIEDLTGQIALAAGRGAMSPIDGVALDIGAFPGSGEIDVLRAQQDREKPLVERIDIGQQIALERARRQK